MRFEYSNYLRYIVHRIIFFILYKKINKTSVCVNVYTIKPKEYYEKYRIICIRVSCIKFQIFTIGFVKKKKLDIKRKRKKNKNEHNHIMLQ